MTARRRPIPAPPRRRRRRGAGQCEAAAAGALGVRLGGHNVYFGHTEVRPLLGDGPPWHRAFVAGPMLGTPRTGHTATALVDGRILLTGGYPDEGRPPLASAEIVDASATAVAPAGPMRTPRGAHTATRLRDGTVPVGDGFDGRRTLSKPET